MLSCCSRKKNNTDKKSIYNVTFKTQTGSGRCSVNKLLVFKTLFSEQLIGHVTRHFSTATADYPVRISLEFDIRDGRKPAIFSALIIVAPSAHQRHVETFNVSDLTLAKVLGEQLVEALLSQQTLRYQLNNRAGKACELVLTSLPALLAVPSPIFLASEHSCGTGFSEEATSHSDHVVSQPNITLSV